MPSCQDKSVDIQAKTVHAHNTLYGQWPDGSYIQPQQPVSVQNEMSATKVIYQFICFKWALAVIILMATRCVV